jgi:DNA-binding NarL/FixJ family response regulator
MRVDDVLEVLTSRERQICVLAGKGLTTAAIAGKLGVDVKTIESHRTSAYRKLGVRPPSFPGVNRPARLGCYGNGTISSGVNDGRTLRVGG